MATSYIENMQAQPNKSAFIPTWKELRQAKRNLSVPFELHLTDHDVPLICEEIIRIVPGKRLVAFAFWGDTAVVAKLFYEPGSAHRHLQRETEGIEQLIQAPIPTPKVLWTGSAQKEKIQIIIFERILNAYSLSEIWEKKGSPEEILPLMKAITIELATQHVLGIVQEDLHLKNFLITKKQILTLDAGNISAFPDILPRAQSIQHLALFFAQLGAGTESFQDILFQTYAEARGWLIKPADVKYLRHSVKKWNEKRWQHYLKKIHRNSSTFVCEKNFRKLTIYDQNYYSNDFAEFVKNPDAFFHNTLILKKGRSATVAKIKLGNRFFVLKRYNLKDFWHRLRRCFRKTRAGNAWKLAQQLHLFGIPTAKPVAYIENRFFGLRGKSYFLMEYIEGPHLGEYFADSAQAENFPSIAKRVLTLLTNLSYLRLTHGDLKKTNILIHHDHPVLIDLDGMIEHRTRLSLKRAHKKELQRFMHNWQQHAHIKSLFKDLMTNEK